MHGLTKSESEVIKVGLCTGCGTFTAVCPRNAITFNSKTEEPKLKGQCAPSLLLVL